MSVVKRDGSSLLVIGFWVYVKILVAVTIRSSCFLLLFVMTDSSCLERRRRLVSCTILHILRHSTMIHQDGIHGVYPTSTSPFPRKYGVRLTSLDLGQKTAVSTPQNSVNSCRRTSCVTSINFCAQRLNCFPSFRPVWRRNDEAKLPTLTSLTTTKLAAPHINKHPSRRTSNSAPNIQLSGQHSVVFYH